MKSRITKPIDDDSRYFESEETESETVYTIRGAKVDKKDIDAVMHILDRHASMDDCDMFGRTFVTLNTAERIRLNQWPTLKQNVLVSANTSVLSQYKKLSNEMLGAYGEMLIRKGIMLPPDGATLQLPVIDLRRNFKRDMSKDIHTISMANVDFTDDDIITLRLAKDKIFRPRFNEFLVRWNKNLYEYIKIEQDESGYIVTYDTYLGDEQFWILNNHVIVSFKPTPKPDGTMACDLKVEDSIIYEELLSKYIPEMKWDNKMQCFWCDTFCLAPDWRNVRAAVMRGTEEDPYESVQLLFNNNEERIMKRIYRDSIYITTNKTELKEKMNVNMAPGVISRIIISLSLVYLFLEIKTPTKVETLSNNIIKQTFDKTIVTSRELYHNE